jgi:hypothetical protein
MIYIVNRSWCYGYEDHGWDILKAFHKKEDAESFLLSLGEGESDDYWIDTLEVI